MQNEQRLKIIKDSPVMLNGMYRYIDITKRNEICKSYLVKIGGFQGITFPTLPQHDMVEYKRI